MNSTTTLRSDTARTGTNPNFSINSNPWRKYFSIDLGTTNVGGTTVNRTVRAGVLVVENWSFNAGALAGQSKTLVIVSTTTNEIYCFSEGDLLEHGNAASPLWHTSLGVAPMMRPGSNIAPPIGVCGTPVVDDQNRRMFVVAMWDDGSGNGNYSIFNIALDTGNITAQQKLIDAGGPGRATFNPNVQDQRTAVNLVSGWLWLGFAAYQAYDKGRYYGWAVAINPDNLSQQLYQPMISLNSSDNWGIYAGGVWGPGGVAAAEDGTVYSLTGNATQLDSGDAAGNNPQDNLTSFGRNYWNGIPAAGPGSINDYFNSIVRLAITVSGSNPQIKVLDWFQGSNFTRAENTADFDFGGSSPVVLPPVNGRQLVAFVPKDGDIFLLDSQNLGQYSTPLQRVSFADALNQNGNDTKVAIAFLETPDGRNILIVGADSNGQYGGFAAFQVDATATPPTLTKLWQSPSQLRDSFGSPIVIANPVQDPSPPPNPIGLAWVIDGDDAGDNFLRNCAMRAYDVLTGKVVYDSTVNNDITEEIPHFTPITSGGNSVFCATSKGFVGFTQFVAIPKSLTFILDRSTFGKDEIDAKEPTPSSIAKFSPAYWIVVRGVLPGELGLTLSNLGSPPQIPTVTLAFDPTLTAAQITALQNMLNAAVLAGPVIPENPSLPDEPQGFLFPYIISFAGDNGFQALANANPPITSTLVTIQGSITANGAALNNSAQIELVTGENPFFIDVNPNDPTQPTWLSFDLRLFKVTENSLRFGVQMSNNEADAPGFVTQVISNLNANNGVVGGDSFDGLTQDEEASALEFNPTDNYGHKVFNFAMARVRILGKTAGPTPFPVRVFFRLFQAQNTVSNFNPSTTYRFASDGTPHGRKIPLLGAQNDNHGNPEYVTIPCFATKRVNLNGPTDMSSQSDPSNAYNIVIVPGEEVDTYFGCWLDINQPQQKFLPKTPPANSNGGWDGPWTGVQLFSIQEAIIAAPHQCLIAEIRYDDAPIPLNATSATSDKIAQRNIAWIDGPNPGLAESRQMTHPIQIRPTSTGALQQDELMILWDHLPVGSHAQLYLPTLSATEITTVSNRLYPEQEMRTVDEHTVAFDAVGVTFAPLPIDNALAPGLLTVSLPAGIRKGDRYNIIVRQLTDAREIIPDKPQEPQIAKSSVRSNRQMDNVSASKPGLAAVIIPRTWHKVDGAFQFAINIKTKETILLNEERLLATLRWMALNMPATKRWYPVLQRYIDYIAGRVRGLGGDPGQILPSPTGSVPGLPGPSPAPSEGIIGKVEGLIFDHFGDFEGFVLQDEAGIDHKFFSRERNIRELAERAKIERLRVNVVAEDHRHIRKLVVY